MYDRIGDIFTYHNNYVSTKCYFETVEDYFIAQNPHFASMVQDNNNNNIEYPGIISKLNKNNVSA